MPIKKKVESDLVNVAYHEAGHCVAALLLGIRFKFVTVVAANDYVGLVKDLPLPKGPFKRAGEGNPTSNDRKLINKHIQIFLAGGIVDEKRKCASNSQTSWDDNRALDLAAVLRNGDYDAAADYLESAQEQLKMKLLTIENWKKIEAIAQELVDKKNLTYEQASVIFIKS